MGFDAFLEEIKEEKPEIVKGLIILKAAPIPNKQPSYLEIKNLYKAIDEIIDDTIKQYEKNADDVNWRENLKPNHQCYEDFCIRKAEGDFIKWACKLLSKVKSRQKFMEAAMLDNIDRIMLAARALLKSERKKEFVEEVEESELVKQETERIKIEQEKLDNIKITDVLKFISEGKAPKLRCPFLDNVEEFAKIDINNTMVNLKKEGKVPEKIENVSKIPDEPIPYPKANCILKEYKPYGCRIHGLDTETLYVGGDLVSSKLKPEQLAYIPIAEELAHKDQKLISTFKWLLISGATTITTELMGDKMRKKEMIK